MFDPSQHLGEFNFHEVTLNAFASWTQLVPANPKRAYLLITANGSNSIFFAPSIAASGGATGIPLSGGQVMEFSWLIHGYLPTLAWYVFGSAAGSPVYALELTFRPH